ncbi:DUF4272 domain-containing protein [Solirubrobacter sp. CPCC 204708]|uniref:DUF4272 domain-containing protein n=1 Tax=Solirubrobacter deserti TaxID=2282478 RepID=A0ABT4RV24_9ACTN|nr:DUF4272 domain-containing protein [Solirubrobacter deserti]MBE2318906.1 DUF4272 domain-containing protein [Solirubrobacter deserti]MDA0142410.1 DUF4272 domain-containing protein [Solirubrobacter deserti]
MHAWDPEAVRAGAVAELAPWGIVPPQDLPRPALNRPRPLEDVVARAQALHGVLDIIHGAPLDAAYAMVAAVGADRWISDAERAYLARVADGVPDVEAEYELSWRAESLYALLWTLGLAADLPLTRELELRPDAFRAVDALTGPAPPGLALRAPEEIAAKLDVLYCAHWAARERVPEQWPEDLEPEAIRERRRALEWLLLTGVEWDAVRLDV